MIALTSMSRGNEVRQVKQCEIGVTDYPTTDTAHTDVFSGRTGTHSMSCFSFINLNGKSNPGDRVDMDVSERMTTVQRGVRPVLLCTVQQ